MRGKKNVGAQLQKRKYKITRLLRIDGNPEGHSSTVNILLFPVNEIHWDIKCIINILLESAKKTN